MKDKKRIEVINEEKFMQMLGGVIPYIDFSNDITLIKDHRHELKKQKQETKLS